MQVKLGMMDIPISFVIMDSLINQDIMQIERLYDIKGSTQGRRTKLPESKLKNSGLTTLKDLNFIDNIDDLDISIKD
jgi:hypothetical protein